MRTSELDYHLPPELIAQKAIEPRDHARMLVVNRTQNSLADRHFYNLPEYLERGDCLVLNDTQVIPARFFLHKPTGGRVECLFLREIETGSWEVMIKGAAKIKADAKLSLEGCDVVFIPGTRISAKTFEMRVDPPVSAVTLLRQFGHVPLPPYIHRADSREDLDRYQTVFNEKPGAVAAPTAGLHFTLKLLDRIRSLGIKIASVTLHVGMGTFEPLTAVDLKDHVMHREWYSVGKEAAETINSAKRSGGKIVAVGTTSVRVLETVADNGTIAPGQGWTNIFIYPPYQFKMVDRMITNFHLPQTTLLALVFAFAGKDLTLQAYQHAVEEKYRFFSYGDAMLIL